MDEQTTHSKRAMFIQEEKCQRGPCSRMSCKHLVLSHHNTDTDRDTSQVVTQSEISVLSCEVKGNEEMEVLIGITCFLYLASSPVKRRATSDGLTGACEVHGGCCIWHSFVV